jgi:DNA polymerase-3 subunit delta
MKQMILSVFSKKPLPRAVVFLGPHALINDYLAKAYARQEQFKDCDLQVLDCQEDGLGELLAALTESSLFSAQKVLLIKNPFFLTSKVPAAEKKNIKQLQTVFAHLQELDDILIFEADYDKLDQRKKLTKLLKQGAEIVDLRLKPYQTGDFLRELAKMEGYSFAPGAFKLLLERSDQVLETTLANYKTLKAITEGQTISRQAVNEHIDLSLAQNVFAILEDDLHHNYQAALHRLDDQLRQGQTAVGLLAVFASQLELLVTIKTLAQRGRSPEQITHDLGIHPYRVKLALRNRYSLTKLRQMLLEVIELDYGYKTGRYQSPLFLQNFLLRQ